jgi:hypothetical protein
MLLSALAIIKYLSHSKTLVESVTMSFLVLFFALCSGCKQSSRSETFPNQQALLTVWSSTTASPEDRVDAIYPRISKST